MIESYLPNFVCDKFINDPHYRNGHLRVINALEHRKVVGLHTPQMKEIAKRINSDGISGVIPAGVSAIRAFEESNTNDLCHEEIMVWAFLINLQKSPLHERMAMLDKYVPVIDNWAVCDAFCSNAKWMAKTDKTILWNYLQKWFNSKREFEVRFAIVTSMCYYMNREWLESIFAKINGLEIDKIISEYKRAIPKIETKLKQNGDLPRTGYVPGNSPYYVRMGIAWLMATALAKFPEETRNFARNSNLPDDITRLYIRKARESFRTREISAI